MSSAYVRPVKFLIVDDREENLVALEALLRRDGLEVLRARSGDDALELLLTHDIALALLDVQMPGMDGFALAELMRGTERTKHVPIIFVTASPEERNRMFRGYDAGAVDFLIKPLEPRVLRHKADVFFRLYQQRQELAETLRLNETFVAAVTHDLRNPLNAVLMSAELLASAPDESTRRVALRLRSSSRRMAGMIDDLMDLARARLGGGIPIERDSADLAAIVVKVIGEFEISDSGTKIEFPDRTPSVGAWDGGRLAQIVSNLIGNALRHGSKNAPVTARLGGDEAKAVFSVHNAGFIPHEVQARLFDPFRTGRDTLAPGAGLGLGLYIVQQLAAAHGGQVEATSSEADGTTFVVTLPRS